ncbi:MAG: hypothetical protein ACOZBL_02810 [Patescibacteria group bacterium]
MSLYVLVITLLSLSRIFNVTEYSHFVGSTTFSAPGFQFNDFLKEKSSPQTISHS